MPKKDTKSEPAKATEEAAESESPKTTEEHAQLESLKMTKEWSVWLILVQSSICTFLWSVLKEKLKSLDDTSPLSDGYSLLKCQVVVLHVGWLSFVVSALIAVTLVTLLPFWIERLAKGPGERKDYHRWKMALTIAEYAFFLLGVACIFFFVLRQFLGAIYPPA